MNKINSCSEGEYEAAFLSLGSNLGDRLLNLREALHRLELHPEIELTALSSVYETDPVGYINQPEFYNIVVQVKTKLSAENLLLYCQSIEDRFQRDRSIEWGPRTMDIDLLLYSDLRVSSEFLMIPHPEMEKRDFVQIPLQEIRDGEVRCTKSVRPVFENWYDHIV